MMPNLLLVLALLVTLRATPREGTDDRGGDTPASLHPLYVHALTTPAVGVYGLDATFLTESVSVAWCESRMREAAGNTTSGATGLLQVMLPLHLPKVHALGYTASDMLHAEPNLRVAAVIWGGRGWAAWSCQP